MIDKQIIIDGKECRYWFRLNSGDYRKCSLRGKNDNCDEIKDCFVKELLGKLALKEQECEELKKDKFALELRLDELTSPVNVEDCEHSVFNGEYIACLYYEGQRCDDADFANCMYRENIRLKQQLDQLKAENDELKKKCNIYTCGICGNKEDCNKLYKTLTEIKEIAKTASKRLYATMSNDYTDGYSWLGSIILQKISECEGNNDMENN